MARHRQSTNSSYLLSPLGSPPSLTFSEQSEDLEVSNSAYSPFLKPLSDIV